MYFTTLTRHTFAVSKLGYDMFLIGWCRWSRNSRQNHRFFDINCSFKWRSWTRTRKKHYISRVRRFTGEWQGKEQCWEEEKRGANFRCWSCLSTSCWILNINRQLLFSTIAKIMYRRWFSGEELCWSYRCFSIPQRCRRGSLY